MFRLLLFIIALSSTNITFSKTGKHTILMNERQYYHNTENHTNISDNLYFQNLRTFSLDKENCSSPTLSNGIRELEAKVFGNLEEKAEAKTNNPDDTDNKSRAIYMAHSETTVLEKQLSPENTRPDAFHSVNKIVLEKRASPENARIESIHEKSLDEAATDNARFANAFDDFPKNIEELIFQKAKPLPDKTQLSIAVIDNGTTKYYGIVKENNSVKKINNKNKIFEIGSITKVFTSTVLASLVLDNKIRLDENINNYYPFTFKDSTQICFEKLANHTSGLPRLPDNLGSGDEQNPYKTYGKTEMEDYLKNHLRLDNGTINKYSYSNLGVGLLGHTLELVQKTSLKSLLKNRVFNKYNMKSSYVSSKGLNNRLVRGIDKDGNEVSNWDFDAMLGAGGILSTTEDLVKFAKAQFIPENKELELTRKPTFIVNDNMSIGLGWHILSIFNNGYWFWHNGGTGGYTSSMAVNVENKSAVIILSNVSTFNPQMKQIDNLCFELTTKMDHSHSN